MRLIRSRVVYVLLIGAVMLYSAIVKSRNAELLMYGVLLLPVLTLLYALLTLPFVKITSADTNADPVKGDAFSTVLTIKNKSILPIPYLTVYTTVSRDVSYDPAEEFMATQISLAPFEERHLELDVLCRRHGYFTAGATGIAVVDYLRLFRLHRPLKAHRIMIYPSVRGGGAALLKALVSPIGGEMAYGGTGLDSPEAADVRPYQPGDSMAHLHHSLSSRGFGRFTRTWEEEGKREITVVYDAGGMEDEHTDLLAHLASALIFDAMGENLEVRLITGLENGAGGVEADDYDACSFKKAFTALAESCRKKCDLDYSLLDGKNELFSGHGRMILFTSALDDKALLFASDVRETGASPVIIAAGHASYGEKIFNALGLEVWFAGEEDDDPVWSLV
ncbi:MAG: DUF58 domain-containing protein [Clostridia bacterium]|nr:DUF58 domain-containing protein [Clostridia bacterium]